MAQTMPQAFMQNFLGQAPNWYKSTIIAFLIANPILFHTVGPFITGWVLILQFIFTLALALKCYPLQPGGLLAIEAIIIGMASPESVYHEALANFEGVTIAAINGYAMGGGLECAMACDIRIAEEHAQMALPEASVGLLPCAGGTQNLPWLVGEGWAKRMILCGERINAATAEKIGLVEEVVGTGESLEKALALAVQAGEQSPISVAFCKELIHMGRDQVIARGLEAERDKIVDLCSTSDQREGVNAFLEKRKPQWKNQ